LSETILEARGLSKVFTRGLLSPGPRRVVAFAGLSLAIPAGSVFGLVGESGSGKSSLARVLVGIDAATEGEVLFAGRPLGAMDGRERRATTLRFQMVHQDPQGALDPRWRVGRSICEALRAAGIEEPLWRSRLEALARSVKLDPGLLERRPHELSGGQRQRCVIARALASSPRFIALDEAVSSLDVSVQAAIVDLLMELKAERDLTYLFVSHDLALVAAICDRIAVMKDGRVVEEGAGAEVIADPSHEYTRLLRDRSLGLRATALGGRTAEPADSQLQGQRSNA
jgi:ABC-type glutathione transport system ATPase component